MKAKDWMTEDNFPEILCYIENDIKKQDTKFQEAISPNIKLAAFIRCWATEASYIDLQYQLCIHQSTLSSMIPEVCYGIY